MPVFRVTRSFWWRIGGELGVNDEGRRVIIGGHDRQFNPGDTIELEVREVQERLDFIKPTAHAYDRPDGTRAFSDQESRRAYDEAVARRHAPADVTMDESLRRDLEPLAARRTWDEVCDAIADGMTDENLRRHVKGLLIDGPRPVPDEVRHWVEDGLFRGSGKPGRPRKFTPGSERFLIAIVVTRIPERVAQHEAKLQTWNEGDRTSPRPLPVEVTPYDQALEDAARVLTNLLGRDISPAAVKKVAQE